jgi:hypothetical protein
MTPHVSRGPTLIGFACSASRESPLLTVRVQRVFTLVQPRKSWITHNHGDLSVDAVEGTDSQQQGRKQ